MVAVGPAGSPAFVPLAIGGAGQRPASGHLAVPGARIPARSLLSQRRRDGRRGQAGFTLFEMVVAVSIFALMAVIAFGGLGQMTRNGQGVANANARLAELQFAAVYFGRDWLQVSARPIRDQYGDQQPQVRLEDGVISFTRNGWDNLLNLPRASLQRVQYLVRDGRMIRRHWRSLDQGIGEEPVEQVLLRNIETLEVTLLDAEGNRLRDWPADTGGESGTPVLLAVEFELDDLGRIRRLLEVPNGVF